jgi:hypothetical protein
MESLKESLLHSIFEVIKTSIESHVPITESLANMTSLGESEEDGLAFAALGSEMQQGGDAGELAALFQQILSHLYQPAKVFFFIVFPFLFLPSPFS